LSESATDFLTNLAQTVAAMSLYEEGHPARERAVDGVLEAILRLQEETPTPDFTFVGNEIVFEGRPLHSLKRWGWGARLGAVGVQRLEFSGPVTRDDLDVFLFDVHARLTGVFVSSAESRQSRSTVIQYGIVGVKGQGSRLADDEERGEGRTVAYTLKEEVEAVDWLHGELKEDGGLHLLEAEAIVRSLTVAMHGDQQFMIPLVRLKRFDQYTTTHAMNVSVLAMALAEFVGLGPKEVRAFGISGLMHDLGKVTIPTDILNKPGKLTDEERTVMNNHPIAGAQIIIETEEHLDLAAVVAYEHHIKIDGGGYPSLRFPRACHQASNLVHVCDVFDALRTDRPYRGAWETERVLGLLDEGSGTEFDHDLAQSFIRMMRQWEGQIAVVEQEDEALPIGVPVGESSGSAPSDDSQASSGPTSGEGT
jgi:HD-GYP domain-containing protein (c-di-GMP phosphodiesterase class II)